MQDSIFSWGSRRNKKGSGLTSRAWAQETEGPTKSVTVVVGDAACRNTDVMARIASKVLFPLKPKSATKPDWRCPRISYARAAFSWVRVHLKAETGFAHDWLAGGQFESSNLHHPVRQTETFHDRHTMSRDVGRLPRRIAQVVRTEMPKSMHFAPTWRFVSAAVKSIFRALLSFRLETGS
jgi:hypothetical protein